MSGKYLLDTNIVIAIFANDEAVIEQLKDADEIFVPGIVAGELYYGAYKSSRSAENITRINEFAASNTILDCDIKTARHYGEIKFSNISVITAPPPT